MRLLALLPVVVASGAWAAGYHWTPPAGFQGVPDAGGLGSLAFVPRPVEEAPGLQEILREGESDTASVVAISIFATPAPAGGAGRDALAHRVARHFRETLGLAFEVDEAHGRQGGTATVTGTVTLAGQVRRLRVVSVEAHGRTAWLVASVPLARWNALEPALTAAFASFQLDALPEPHPTAPWAAALAGAALVAAAAWWLRARR